MLRLAIVTALALALWPAVAADSHPGHGPVVVSIGDLAYAPTQVTVVVGDVVLWDWAGPDTNHSVTADAGQALSFDSDAGKDAGQINHPVHDGFSVRVTQPGTFAYHCKVHSFMKGQIVVNPAPPTTAGPAPVAATLTGVRVTRLSPRRGHTRVLVRFTVNEAVSMRATLRRTKAGRATGRVLKEVDFSGPPGSSQKRLDLGRRSPGVYQLRLVAIDQSSGAATKPVLARVVVKR